MFFIKNRNTEQLSKAKKYGYDVFVYIKIHPCYFSKIASQQAVNQNSVQVVHKFTVLFLLKILCKGEHNEAEDWFKNKLYYHCRRSTCGRGRLIFLRIRINT